MLAWSDNAPASWGTEVDGLPVLSPPEAAARYGKTAAFVVTIWRAQRGHYFPDTRRQLEALGEAGRVDGAGQRLEQLEQEFARVKIEIENQTRKEAVV